MKTLIKTSISFKPIELFKIILNRANHKIARKNIKINPQLAIFSFDHIGLSINLNGRYEDSILCILELFFNKNLAQVNKNIALDVGANIGNHSIFLSKFFKEVHSFEPNPFTYDILTINSKYAAPNNNIISYKIGISDKECTLPFSINRTNFGNSKIDFENNSNKDQILIEVQSIDKIDYFKEKNISLIKIDVEGHEINVLRGAKKTIKSHKPIILFEQGADEIHNGSSEAIDYLTSLDYSFYSIKRRFCLGENILAKIFSVALRSIFGDQLSLVETKKFPKKFNQSVKFFTIFFVSEGRTCLKQNLNVISLT